MLRWLGGLKLAVATGGRSQSARGLAPSMTLRAALERDNIRQVLECASPLALFHTMLLTGSLSRASGRGGSWAHLDVEDHLSPALSCRGGEGEELGKNRYTPLKCDVNERAR